MIDNNIFTNLFLSIIIDVQTIIMFKLEDDELKMIHVIFFLTILFQDDWGRWRPDV